MMNNNMVLRSTAELSTHFAESARLEQEIRNNLKGLGYEW
ncbi:MAG: hypothetical protein RL594_13 [Bacteroidota bacterium]|jgi:hypothetical protein